MSAVSRPQEHTERLLDEALAATFPASDPIAVSARADSSAWASSGEE